MNIYKNESACWLVLTALAVALAPVTAGGLVAQESPPGVLPSGPLPPPVFHRLSNSVKELSGLAISEDGRLFGHDDERGRISEFDPESGDIIHVFDLDGKPRGDFEGLAIRGQDFYLITSAGTLVAFRHPGDDGEAEFTQTKTGLRRVCEIEGLTNHPQLDAHLLIACKKLPGRRNRGRVVVYAWDIAGDSLLSEPYVDLESDDLADGDDSDAVLPSGIDITSEGTVLIVAASGPTLLELSPSGELLRRIPLSSRAHRQPESVVYWPSGRLTIGDEGNGRRARLTHYDLSLISEPGGLHDPAR